MTNRPRVNKSGQSQRSVSACSSASYSSSSTDLILLTEEDATPAEIPSELQRLTPSTTFEEWSEISSRLHTCLTSTCTRDNYIASLTLIVQTLNAFVINSLTSESTLSSATSLSSPHMQEPQMQQQYGNDDLSNHLLDNCRRWLSLKLKSNSKPAISNTSITQQQQDHHKLLSLQCLTLNTQGTLAMKQNDIQGAITCYEDALEIFQESKQHQQHNSNTGNSLRIPAQEYAGLTHLNLSMVYTSRKQHEKALFHAQTAAVEQGKYLESILSHNNNNTSMPPFPTKVNTLVLSYFNVGTEWEHLSRYDLALNAYADAVHASRKYLGDTHPITRQFEVELFDAQQRLQKLLSLQQLQKQQQSLNIQKKNNLRSYPMSVPIIPLLSASAASHNNYLSGGGESEEAAAGQKSSRGKRVVKVMQSISEQSKSSANPFEPLRCFSPVDVGIGRKAQMRVQSARSAESGSHVNLEKERAAAQNTVGIGKVRVRRAPKLISVDQSNSLQQNLSLSSQQLPFFANSKDTKSYSITSRTIRNSQQQKRIDASATVSLTASPNSSLIAVVPAASLHSPNNSTFTFPKDTGLSINNSNSNFDHHNSLLRNQQQQQQSKSAQLLPQGGKSEQNILQLIYQPKKSMNVNNLNRQRPSTSQGVRNRVSPSSSQSSSSSTTNDLILSHRRISQTAFEDQSSHFKKDSTLVSPKSLQRNTPSNSFQIKNYESLVVKAQEQNLEQKLYQQQQFPQQQSQLLKHNSQSQQELKPECIFQQPISNEQLTSRALLTSRNEESRKLIRNGEGTNSENQIKRLSKRIPNINVVQSSSKFSFQQAPKKLLVSPTAAVAVQHRIDNNNISVRVSDSGGNTSPANNNNNKADSVALILVNPLGSESLIQLSPVGSTSRQLQKNEQFSTTILPLQKQKLSPSNISTATSFSNAFLSSIAESKIPIRKQQQSKKVPSEITNKRPLEQQQKELTQQEKPKQEMTVIPATNAIILGCFPLTYNSNLAQSNLQHKVQFDLKSYSDSMLTASAVMRLERTSIHQNLTNPKLTSASAHKFEIESILECLSKDSFKQFNDAQKHQILRRLASKLSMLLTFDSNQNQIIIDAQPPYPLIDIHENLPNFSLHKISLILSRITEVPLTSEPALSATPLFQPLSFNINEESQTKNRQSSTSDFLADVKPLFVITKKAQHSSTVKETEQDQKDTLSNVSEPKHQQGIEIKEKSRRNTSRIANISNESSIIQPIMSNSKLPSHSELVNKQQQQQQPHIIQSTKSNALHTDRLSSIAFLPSQTSLLSRPSPVLQGNQQPSNMMLSTIKSSENLQRNISNFNLNNQTSQRMFQSAIPSIKEFWQTSELTPQLNYPSISIPWIPPTFPSPPPNLHNRQFPNQQETPNPHLARLNSDQQSIDQSHSRFEGIQQRSQQLHSQQSQQHLPQQQQQYQQFQSNMNYHISNNHHNKLNAPSRIDISNRQRTNPNQVESQSIQQFKKLPSNSMDRSQGLSRIGDINAGEEVGEEETNFDAQQSHAAYQPITPNSTVEQIGSLAEEWARYFRRGNTGSVVAPSTTSSRQSKQDYPNTIPQYFSSQHSQQIAMQQQQQQQQQLQQSQQLHYQLNTQSSQVQYQNPYISRNPLSANPQQHMLGEFSMENSNNINNNNPRQQNNNNNNNNNTISQNNNNQLESKFENTMDFSKQDDEEEYANQHNHILSFSSTLLTTPIPKDSSRRRIRVNKTAQEDSNNDCDDLDDDDDDDENHWDDQQQTTIKQSLGTSASASVLHHTKQSISGLSSQQPIIISAPPITGNPIIPQMNFEDHSKKQVHQTIDENDAEERERKIRMIQSRLTAVAGQSSNQLLTRVAESENERLEDLSASANHLGFQYHRTDENEFDQQLSSTTNWNQIKQETNHILQSNISDVPILKRVESNYNACMKSSNSSQNNESCFQNKIEGVTAATIVTSQRKNRDENQRTLEKSKSEKDNNIKSKKNTNVKSAKNDSNTSLQRNEQSILSKNLQDSRVDETDSIHEVPGPQSLARIPEASPTSSLSAALANVLVTVSVPAVSGAAIPSIVEESATVTTTNMNQKITSPSERKQQQQSQIQFDSIGEKKGSEQQPQQQQTQQQSSQPRIPSINFSSYPSMRISKKKLSVPMIIISPVAPSSEVDEDEEEEEEYSQYNQNLDQDIAFPQNNIIRINFAAPSAKTEDTEDNNNPTHNKSQLTKTEDEQLLQQSQKEEQNDEALNKVSLNPLIRSENVEKQEETHVQNNLEQLSEQTQPPSQKVIDMQIVKSPNTAQSRNQTMDSAGDSPGIAVSDMPLIHGSYEKHHHPLSSGKLHAIHNSEKEGNSYTYSTVNAYQILRHKTDSLKILRDENSSLTPKIKAKRDSMRNGDIISFQNQFQMIQMAAEAAAAANSNNHIPGGTSAVTTSPLILSRFSLFAAHSTDPSQQQEGEVVARETVPNQYLMKPVNTMESAINTSSSSSSGGSGFSGNSNNNNNNERRSSEENKINHKERREEKYDQQDFIEEPEQEGETVVTNVADNRDVPSSSYSSEEQRKPVSMVDVNIVSAPSKHVPVTAVVTTTPSIITVAGKKQQSVLHSVLLKKDIRLSQMVVHTDNHDEQSPYFKFEDQIGGGDDNNTPVENIVKSRSVGADSTPDNVDIRSKVFTFDAQTIKRAFRESISTTHNQG